VLGHTVTTTDITLGGMRSDERPRRGGKLRGKPPRDLRDPSLVGDGSAR
jgi:hypothetical protein